VEDVITLAGVALHSFVSLEGSEADSAAVKSQVSVLFEEYECLDASEVLVCVVPKGVDLAGQVLADLGGDHLLVDEVVNNSARHQVYAILVQSVDKVLAAVNLVLNCGVGSLKQIETFLVLHVDLADDLEDALADSEAPLVNLVPRHDQDGEDEDDQVVEDAPRDQERVGFCILDADGVTLTPTFRLWSLQVSAFEDGTLLVGGLEDPLTLLA